jgi:hypothetical protein
MCSQWHTDKLTLKISRVQCLSSPDSLSALFRLLGECYISKLVQNLELLVCDKYAGQQLSPAIGNHRPLSENLFNLRTALEKTFDGLAVLQTSNYSRLEYQTELTEIVVNEFVNNNRSMGQHEFETKANKIVEIFHEENAINFFVPAKLTSNGKRVKGHLVHRCCNYTEKLRKLGLLGDIYIYDAKLNFLNMFDVIFRTKTNL